jgi:hypothetical protein
MQLNRTHRVSSAVAGAAGSWQPLDLTCTACDGGEYSHCPYCKGTGKISIAANHDARGGARRSERAELTPEIA